MKRNGRTTASLERETHDRLVRVSRENGWPVGTAVAIAICLLEKASDDERREAIYELEAERMERRLTRMVGQPPLDVHLEGEGRG